jgi:hypothetical protein
MGVFSRREGGGKELSRSEIVDLLSRRKRLKSKDFLEFYDMIWENNAPVKYLNPNHVMREHLETILKQCYGPPF